MKKFTLLLTVLFMASISFQTMAQSNREDAKKEMKKEKREIKQQAKKWRKKGYSEAPGAQSMEKQIYEVYIRNMEFDKNGKPIYLVSTGIFTGETESAAKVAALETAKRDVASKLGSEIIGNVKTNIRNKQLKKDAVSVTEVITKSEALIQQELGTFEPLTEFYKETDNGNIQCALQIAYDKKEALEIAKNVIRKQLEQKLNLDEKEVSDLLD